MLGVKTRMVTVYANAPDIMGRRLYTGKTTWIREYLQNSIDAGATDIEIIIRGNELCINDNGIGMDQGEIEEKAFSLGSPETDPGKIGELGIGFYAGLGISDKIRVLTKKRKSSVFEATFDAGKYYRILSDEKKRRLPFEQVLKEVFSVKISTVSASETDQFTRIIFEDLLEDRTNIPTVSQIEEFVKDNINVEISKKFQWKKEVDDFCVGFGKKVRISVDDGSGSLSQVERYDDISEELFPPYTKVIQIPGLKGEPMLKAWFCYAKSGRSFNESGVLVRYKGMVIGDKDTLSFRTGARIERRLVGEILVSEKAGLEVNSERNWFANSGRLNTFQKELTKLLSEVHSYYPKLDSDFGVVINNMNTRVQDLERKKGENIKLGNKGTVSALESQISNLKHSMEQKRQKRDKKITELQKVINDEPKNQLAARALELLEERKAQDPATIYQSAPQGSNEDKQPRKSSFPTAVQTFLRENMIDPELAKDIESGNTRQVASSAFIFIELLLKKRAGWPPAKKVDNVQELLQDFKSKNDPPDLKGGDIGKFYENFSRLIISFFYFFRHPASHSFMKELDKPRHIFQAMMIGDYVVYLIEQFKQKPT